MRATSAVLLLLGACGPLRTEESGYAARMRGHLEGVLREGKDRYGADVSDIWLACLDARTGGLPASPHPARRRWYREIHSPNGANLYWDQPMLVAAVHLGYREAVERYIRGYLARSTTADGLILWGNHAYYGVRSDKAVRFEGGHHELRPFPPAWELLASVDPEATARQIREMGRQHVKNPSTGLFCRHGSFDGGVPKEAGAMPFLEAGAVLTESLARVDPGLALKVARYSFAQRGPTGLLRNQPGKRRWDYEASTTECGLWAGSLLRAADRTGNAEFAAMAREVVTAYLRHGFDESSGGFHGQVAVADGRPLVPASIEHQPAAQSTPWQTATHPTHDYPMPFAEACATLYERTGDPLFAKAVRRWADVVRRSVPVPGGAYAEDYGRVIRFLLRAAEILKEPAWRDLARRVADEAVAVLYIPESGLFRSHPGEDRCDAVDGLGFLFLALLHLETGRSPDLLGLGY